MTGKAALDNIIVGISTLMALGLLGIFVYTEVLYEKELPNDKTEFEKMINMAEGQRISQAFNLGKLVVNLPSRSKRLRFLEVNMEMKTFDFENHHKYLQENITLIKDSVIATVSAMTPNELNTVSGKILLENRLRKNINRVLHKDVVKEIYFTRYVVQ